MSRPKRYEVASNLLLTETQVSFFICHTDLRGEKIVIRMTKNFMSHFHPFRVLFLDFVVVWLMQIIFYIFPRWKFGSKTDEWSVRKIYRYKKFKLKFKIFSGKRSRKAQQEAKNKNGNSESNNNNDEKHSRSSSSSSNQSSTHRNGISEKVMTNLTNSNFHFSKSIDPSHQQPNSIMPLPHQRHPSSAKEVLANGAEESFASNLVNRAQPFISEGEDLIWRVV